MDRKEFSAKIAAIRGDKSLSQISYDCRIPSSSVSCIINATADYRMGNVVSILKSLDHLLVVESLTQQKVFVFESTEDMRNWLVWTDEHSHLTKSSFARKLGVSVETLRNALTGKSLLRVDNFLRWAEVTDFGVDLKDTVSAWTRLHPMLK